MAGQQLNDVYVTGNAAAHIGDVYQSLIVPTVAPLNEYAGSHANNALRPVTTYVDRPDFRRQLEEQLHSHIDISEQRTRIVIVHGIGGVGKTQLVTDYIQRYKSDYSAVFWIEAANLKTLERDFVQIYQLLYHVQIQFLQRPIQIEDALPAVKSWFNGRHERYLFVFDNADSISDPTDPCYIDLLHCLPDDPCIHVCITSRDRSTINMTVSEPVEVGEMSLVEAVTLFRKQAKITSLSPQQEGHVVAIVQEPGCLALAVTLAGSYVASTPQIHSDLARYLPEYKERRQVLLAQRPSRIIHRYGASVLTTWETTYLAVQRQNPDACHFLALFSFFNSDDISQTFLISDLDGQPSEWISRLIPGKKITVHNIEDILRTLTEFSIVRHSAAPDEEYGRYRMHNLVQTWAYDRLDFDQQKHYRHIELLLMSMMIEQTNFFSDLKLRARVLAHLVTSCNKISILLKDAPAEDRPMLELLESLCAVLLAYGHAEDAVGIVSFLAEKYTSWCGGADPGTLKAVNLLTMTIRSAGNLKRALVIQRSLVATLGPIQEIKFPALVWVSNLGVILTESGFLQEALPIHRALVTRAQEIAVRDDNEHTLIFRQNLASTLLAFGHTEEAYSMFSVILPTLLQIHSNSHIWNTGVMTNMGRALRELRKFDESESILRATIAKKRRYLGWITLAR